MPPFYRLLTEVPFGTFFYCLDLFEIIDLTTHCILWVIFVGAKWCKVESSSNNHIKQSLNSPARWHMVCLKTTLPYRTIYPSEFCVVVSLR